jgi:hypothetical protein
MGKWASPETADSPSVKPWGETAGRSPLLEYAPFMWCCSLGFAFLFFGFLFRGAANDPDTWQTGGDQIGNGGTILMVVGALLLVVSVVIAVMQRRR